MPFLLLGSNEPKQTNHMMGTEQWPQMNSVAAISAQGKKKKQVKVTYQKTHYNLP